MRTRIVVGLATLLGLLHAAWAVDTNPPFDDPALNERYQTLIREVRCMKCQNESIADSPVDVAADLRREIHTMIGDGKSDEEIANFLKARYGDFILYRPPLEPKTWALWGAPIALLGIGAIVFARVVKKRVGQPIEEDDA
jgi:cytochrome c-type biogenesis protein CcmH